MDRKNQFKYQLKKNLTRFGLLLLCGAMVLPLFGCSRLEQDNVKWDEESEADNSNTPEKYKPSKDVIKLEYINIMNDTKMFIELNNLQATTLKELKDNADMPEEERKDKSNIVINDYISNIYALASSRVASDIESVYINTESYMKYLALLQTFVDSYASEAEAFQNAILEGNGNVTKSGTYKAFKAVENYYIASYDSMKKEEKEATEVPSWDQENSESETEKAKNQ